MKIFVKWDAAVGAVWQVMLACLTIPTAVIEPTLIKPFKHTIK